MKKITLCLALLAVLSGCATTEKFNAKMDGFIGQPDAVVVGAYGPPDSSYTLADGSKVIQYTRGGTAVMPGATALQPITTNTRGTMSLDQGIRAPVTGNYTQTSTTYVTQQSPGMAISLSCTVRFTLDPAGIVRKWSASGNNCTSQG